MKKIIAIGNSIAAVATLEEIRRRGLVSREDVEAMIQKAS
jgi:hypothetical protein